MEDIFSTEATYLFGFNYNGGKPEEVIAGKPTSVDTDKLLFHFMYGHHSLSEYVKKEDIVAVGDRETGTIQISGWSGKFRILNQSKFEEYVQNGAIELKK